MTSTLLVKTHRGAPSLLIRADADNGSGHGHVMRCLALAQGWLEVGGQAFFLGRCESSFLLNQIKASGICTIPLKSVPAGSDDLQETLAVVAGIRPDWIALDGYRFEPHYQETLHRVSTTRLLVVDDEAQWPIYHADVILNQNLGAISLRYHAPGQPQQLLGSRYAMLRREFVSWPRQERVFSRVASKVLITLGGSGSLAKMSKMMEVLQQIDVKDLEVRIVAGAGLPRETITAYSQGKGLVVMEAVCNMPELMAWADVAVIAGGSTCWEAAFMGLPSLVIVLSDNQVANAEGMARAGAGVNLGRFQDASASRLAQTLNLLLRDAEARHKMSAQGRLLVDEHGVVRVVKVLNSHSPASVIQ